MRDLYVALVSTAALLLCCIWLLVQYNHRLMACYDTHEYDVQRLYNLEKRLSL